MKIIKSILNKTISMMVTRNRVLKATRCSIYDFDKNVFDWVDHKCYRWREYNDLRIDGLDLFRRDFRKEGWCKTELRSIIHTLFNLNEEIENYGIYWF